MQVEDITQDLFDEARMPLNLDEQPQDRESRSESDIQRRLRLQHLGQRVENRQQSEDIKVLQADRQDLWIQNQELNDVKRKLESDLRRRDLDRMQDHQEGLRLQEKLVVVRGENAKLRRQLIVLQERCAKLKDDMNYYKGTDPALRAQRYDVMEAEVAYDRRVYMTEMQSAQDDVADRDELLQRSQEELIRTRSERTQLHSQVADLEPTVKDLRQYLHNHLSRVELGRDSHTSGSEHGEIPVGVPHTREVLSEDQVVPVKTQQHVRKTLMEMKMSDPDRTLHRGGLLGFGADTERPDSSIQVRNPFDSILTNQNTVDIATGINAGEESTTNLPFPESPLPNRAPTRTTRRPRTSNTFDLPSTPDNRPFWQPHSDAPVVQLQCGSSTSPDWVTFTVNNVQATTPVAEPLASLHLDLRDELDGKLQKFIQGRGKKQLLKKHSCI